VSAFSYPFLFLRHPNGGVEDLDRMKAAGFAGVFCNIGDHAPEAWEAIVRPRALAQGMFCGPWARTAGAGNTWAPHVLEELVRVADRWGSPLIVNAESEIKESGAEITGQIAEEVGDRDGAISMEAWLFNPPSIDWRPVSHLPMLLQIFPQESPPSSDPEGCKWHAHECGIDCVYFTFGSYGGVKPSLFDLASPYSVFTGDDCGGDYEAWSPTRAGFEACASSAPAPASGLIGSQDGINASIDRLIALDPGGSKPNRTSDMATWGAYDKLRRTLTMLVDAHDGV
jgi:hypothetical protein